MGKNKESPDNRLLDMATLGCVFSRQNVLNDHSQLANEIGDVHKRSYCGNLGSDELAQDNMHGLFALLLLSASRCQVISSNWFANSHLIDVASTVLSFDGGTKRKLHGLHGLQPGTVFRTSWVKLSCRLLADIVTLDIPWNAFLNLFSSLLKVVASFIVQRGVPGPMELSLGYATVS